MSEFWQKYKDPRWQRRRLEVMEKANFACQNCEAIEKTLNVHHKIYRKKANPWDYADHELLCLCEDCHEAWHGTRNRLNEAIALMDSVDLEQIAGYAEAMLLFQNRDDWQKMKICSYYDADGASDAIGYQPMGAYELLDSRDPNGVITAEGLLRIYKNRRGSP